MKKKLIIIISLPIILISALLIIYFNSDFYYSKKLVKAIEREDCAEIQTIIEKHPDAINTYPSISPDWWQSVMGIRIHYPLAVACKTDNIEIVKLLVENGADVNITRGVTALSLTYLEKKENWYDISVYLIDNGASLDYVTDYLGDRFSILEDICIKRHGVDNEDEVYSAFVYALAHIEKGNIDWPRALQAAVSNDRIGIVELLLSEGFCDVNTGHSDMKPLMFAARDSNAEMVQLLLSYGADKNAVDKNGKSALDYAKQSGKDEIVELLS